MLGLVLLLDAEYVLFIFDDGLMNMKMLLNPAMLNPVFFPEN